MRPVREITAEEENFRVEPAFSPTEQAANPGLSRVGFIKRDPVKAEPEGTIILMAFRITGFDRDCDGSLMCRFEQIDKNGESTGWEPDRLGLYPCTHIVATEEEWRSMFGQ